ncbi:3'-5' exonuclease [Streptomyces sp. NPDC002215]|uniref:3'-5' exonuclease n=1 Tax=Streptomyces sp. NPDC002215 TaxID=3154412 RepID=UPI00331CC322
MDVEGNGATPPDLVEVAALPVRDGRPDTSTAGAWLINPPRPVTPFAARVHGLTSEILANSPTWQELADQVHSVLGNAWICGHNVHVDYRALKAHLPKWEPAGVIDTLRLARATYKGLPSYGLDTLINHIRPDLSAAPAHRHRATVPPCHRATYDAYATAQILIAMADQYETWDQLIAVAVPPGMPGAPEPEKDATLW